MDEKKISRQMREDWDRRIAHDYRFWMSDGNASDDVMWETGERDFSIITRDIDAPEDKTIVEIGCGVGRLLRAALKQYGKVIGVDVSEVALEKVKDLIGQDPKLQLVLGNGIDLSEIPSQSVDVVMSYASITSVPTEVIARYLIEANRVLKPGASLRLQMYLGKEQEVSRDDTLHLRCFDEVNFTKALEKAGFTCQWIEELELPFQVSFQEIGIVAKVVSFVKTSEADTTAEEVASTLLPNGEPETSTEISGRDVEYWMSLNYAKELAEKGDIAEARATLEFALAHAKTTTLDVQDLLQQITELVEKKEALQKIGATSETKVQALDFSGELFEANLRVVRDRFPQVASILESISSGEVGEPEVKETSEGVVFSLDGQVLDHPTAPSRGADSWVKTQLQREAIAVADEIVIFGFGGGYHVESFLREKHVPISVIEPSAVSLRKVLGCRDLREVLLKIKFFSVGADQEQPEYASGVELIVRPQSQTLFADECSKVKAAFHGSRGLEKLSPTITVLGPIQGGTLPILGYTVHALTRMQQRVRSIDMSCFTEGFKGLDNFVHQEQRQAMLRGKYTEAISDMILEIADEKPMDILICMAQAPITGKTLQELRNRGVVTVLWFVEDYLRFQVWKYMAQYYDFIFTIQRDECLSAIKAAGAGEVHYLPTAADPYIHSPVELSEEEKQRWGGPMSFVGAGYHNRQQMFASLANLPLRLWGTEWPECKPFDRMVQEGGRRLKPEEYVKIFNATDININLHSSTERDGVDPAGDFLNPRTFELASCGAFQLVDHRKYLPEVFEADKEVAVFHDRDELIEKLHYYTAHPEARVEMARNARDRIFREHTYEHRLKDMLSIIYSSKYEHLKRREDQSPWAKMKKRAEPHPELKQRCDASFAKGEEPTLDGLVADIVTGEGKLSETEQKLLFLHHVRKQMIRMRHEERVKS